MRSSYKNSFELLFLTAAQVSIPLRRASSTIKLPMKPLAPVTSIFICKIYRYLFFSLAKLTQFYGKCKIIVKNHMIINFILLICTILKDLNVFKDLNNLIDNK